MNAVKKTWLVQRLERPYSLNGRINPFVFGGGLRNGGLTDEAAEMLSKAFSFEYMGAAEFEFGAVPEALQRLAQSRAECVAQTVMFDASALKVIPYQLKRLEKPSGTYPFHILCHRDLLGYVKSLIAMLLADKISLREPTHLPECLLTPKPGQENYLAKTVGWLELDNGFFFFRDPEMFLKTLEIFGLTFEEGAPCTSD